MSLLPSEINSISLRLINITYILALLGLLAGSVLYSSNNCIFLMSYMIRLKPEVNHLNWVFIFHIRIRNKGI